MLATIGGFLALLAGLAVLVVPLLVPELSRPRDAFWGALVLLLGLVLVTSAERLSGAPMLAVLCGGLLIGRLGTEVSLGRWRQLSDEERLSFWSPERWQLSLSQLGVSLNRLLGVLLASTGTSVSWLRQRAARAKPAVTKRWVRPEAPAGEPEVAPEQEQQAEPPPSAAAAGNNGQTGESGGNEAAIAATIEAPEATPTSAESEPEPEPPSEPESEPVSAAAETPAPQLVEVGSFQEVDLLVHQALVAGDPALHPPVQPAADDPLPG
jgi:hypothetical protein